MYGPSTTPFSVSFMSADLEIDKPHSSYIFVILQVRDGSKKDLLGNRNHVYRFIDPCPIVRRSLRICKPFAACFESPAPNQASLDKSEDYSINAVLCASTESKIV